MAESFSVPHSVLDEFSRYVLRWREKADDLGLEPVADEVYADDASHIVVASCDLRGQSQVRWEITPQSDGWRVITGDCVGSQSSRMVPVAFFSSCVWAARYVFCLLADRAVTNFFHSSVLLGVSDRSVASGWEHQTVGIDEVGFLRSQEQDWDRLYLQEWVTPSLRFTKMWAARDPSTFMVSHKCEPVWSYLLPKSLPDLDAFFDGRSSL